MLLKLATLEISAEDPLCVCLCTFTWTKCSFEWRLALSEVQEQNHTSNISLPVSALRCYPLLRYSPRASPPRSSCKSSIQATLHPSSLSFWVNKFVLLIGGVILAREHNIVRAFGLQFLLAYSSTLKTCWRFKRSG